MAENPRIVHKKWTILAFTAAYCSHKDDCSRQIQNCCLNPNAVVYLFTHLTWWTCSSNGGILWLLGLKFRRTSFVSIEVKNIDSFDRRLVYNWFLQHLTTLEFYTACEPKQHRKTKQWYPLQDSDNIRSRVLDHTGPGICSRLVCDGSNGLWSKTCDYGKCCDHSWAHRANLSQVSLSSRWLCPTCWWNQCQPNNPRHW